jgi:membrane associated rhomboid family serine protease
MLYFFASPLERGWGTQRFLVRTALLTVVPAVVTTLIGLAFGRVAVQPYVGLATLGVAYITAFASQMRDARVMMFPLPLQLTGDQLLMFEGGMLALWVLFGGLTPFIPELAGFAMGLAWFRFDVTRTLRRSWLRHRQSRLEAQVGKLRRDRKLRVVRDDDGDDERYLH